MRHITAPELARLEPLLTKLRQIDGLVEKKPGVFYRRSRAFLHFHADRTGIHADVRLGADFERHRVESAAEQAALLRGIRAVVG